MVRKLEFYLQWTQRAKIVDVKPERIQKELADNKVVVVTGFQGVSEYNDVTTIGRGGSDTSAVVLAAALGATECEILLMLMVCIQRILVLLNRHQSCRLFLMTKCLSWQLWVHRFFTLELLNVPKNII